jgi:hypothetical protein
VKDVRGLRETADVDNLHKILQAPEVHVRTPVLRIASILGCANLADYSVCHKRFLLRETELVLAIALWGR